MEISIATPLAEELGGDIVFGGDDELVGFRADIGDAPIGITLAKLQKSLGKADTTASLLGRFELVLVPHRFSLIKTTGWAEVINAGIRISYDMGDKTCSVVSLLPEYEYVTIGKASFGASVSAKGETEAVAEIPGDMAPVVGGAQLRAQLMGNASIQVRGNIATPRISAVGKGSQKCEWQFMLGKEPLYGRDIETWAILAVPANLDTIKYKLQLNITHRTAFIPTRWESDIYQNTCSVDR
jgi:hypothetical protein